jgi:hypothetical protein
LLGVGADEIAEASLGSFAALKIVAATTSGALGFLVNRSSAALTFSIKLV